MAKRPSPADKLYEFLANAEPRALGTFFHEHPDAAQKFLGLNQTQLRRYIDLLRGPDEDKAVQACHRVDDCLKARRKYVSEFIVHNKSPLVKHPQNQHHDLVQSIYSTGRTLRDVSRGNLYGAYSNLSKATAELYAGTMSAFGVGKTKRQLVLSAVTLPASFYLASSAAMTWGSLFAGAAMGTLAAVNDAEAALPAAPEPIQQNQEFDTARLGPLELTVTPGKLRAPFNELISGSPYKLMASLERKVKDDPQIAQYVAWLKEAAVENNIDPHLFVNQLYKESFWFKPEVVNGTEKSPKGATGIAQFMPGTAAMLGINPLNPKEAIFGAAKFMGDLTKKYGGDQHLAMVVYNGREDALNFVKKELGQEDITIEQWVEFMENRQLLMGTDARHAWHVETLGYIKQISSAFWENGLPRQIFVKLPPGPEVPLPFRPT